jgi:tRNA(fMet)-specific endonuclease VapC
MEYSRILVDSSIFIDFLRKKDKTKTELFKIPDETNITISTVTLFELFAGATDEQKWKDVRELTDDLPIIPFSKEISEEAAKISHELRKKNKMIEFRDIFIAATARNNEIPVKTINKKHFERINNLKVF